MLPTIDLVNDCFRFVTGFFSIISASPPHIYHSALLLSPKMSIVRKLYESHAHPLTRIVSGLPSFWEQSIASVGFPSSIETAVWSPCSRFIAIAWMEFGCRAAVELLDAVTLGRLNTFPVDEESLTRHLSFSPGARLLTWFGSTTDWIISWDVQTGVLVSSISPESQGYSYGSLSTTYSKCGAMVGLCSPSAGGPTISIYNILSGTHVYSHSVEGLKSSAVWTHGECLRFSAMESGIATIWEVGFTSTDTPVEIESLPIPDNVPSRPNVPHFYPTLSQLAFIIDESVVVWDTQCSRYLLDSIVMNRPKGNSFSSDGSFFACGSINSGEGAYLWKGSPTGYVLHQRLISDTHSTTPCISPNAELVITFGGPIIQLWHTKDSNTISTTPTQALQADKRTPLLGFSQNGELAAVAQVKDMTVTVLDLNSGVPRFIINTGIEVHGVGVARSTIVVVGDKKIITWNLPTSGCVLNPKLDVGDSVQTTIFDSPPTARFPLGPPVVSPDLRHIVFMEVELSGSLVGGMHLYDVSTGQCLASVNMPYAGSLWFSLDGHEVWRGTSIKFTGWRIIKDSISNISKLEDLGSTSSPPNRLPWQCPPGYQVTDNGWILHSSGEWLLWLPPHWWPQWDRIWGGKFLALLNGKLSETLILELK